MYIHNTRFFLRDLNLEKIQVKSAISWYFPMHFIEGEGLDFEF